MISKGLIIALSVIGAIFVVGAIVIPCTILLIPVQSSKRLSLFVSLISKPFHISHYKNIR
jgi:hypothetical protein